MWRKIIYDYRLYYLNDLFEIKWIFYGLSRMLQFSEFVWALSGERVEYRMLMDSLYRGIVQTPYH